MYSKLSKKTKSWFYEAIENCMSHPQYSVGIFFNSNDLKKLFTDGIEDLIKNVYWYNDIEYIANSSIATSIKLKNKSVIHLFNVGDLPNWKARRYACIIYDADIDKSYIIRLIKQLAMPFEENGKKLSKIYKIKFK